jgi:hypothetical protein
MPSRAVAAGDNEEEIAMSAMRSIDDNQGMRGRVVGWWKKCRETAAIRAAARVRADVEAACPGYDIGLDAATLRPAAVKRPTTPNMRMS